MFASMYIVFDCVIGKILCPNERSDHSVIMQTNENYASTIKLYAKDNNRGQLIDCDNYHK